MNASFDIKPQSQINVLLNEKTNLMKSNRNLESENQQLKEELKKTEARIKYKDEEFLSQIRNHLNWILSLKDEIFNLKYENENSKKDDDVEIVYDNLEVQIHEDEPEVQNLTNPEIQRSRIIPPTRRYSEFQPTNIRKTYDRRLTISDARTFESSDESLLVEVDPSNKFLQRPIKCGFCDKQFLYRKRLKSHMEIHHKNVNEFNKVTELKNKRKFTCDLAECSFGTDFKPALLRHVKSHTSETFKCRKCNYITKQKKRFENHNAIVHERNSDKGYGSVSPFEFNGIPIGRMSK